MRRASFGLEARRAPRRAAGFRILLLSALVASACKAPSVSAFPWTDRGGRPVDFVLQGRGEEGREGELSGERPLGAFLPAKPLVAGPAEALELELGLVSGEGREPAPAAAPGAEPLRLKVSLSSRRDGAEPFLVTSLALRDPRCSFVLPLPEGRALARVELSLEGGPRGKPSPGGGGSSGGAAGPALLEVKSIRQAPLFRGYESRPEGPRLSPGFSLYASGSELKAVLERPFEGQGGGAALVLDYGRAPAGASLRIEAVDAAGAVYPFVARLRSGGAILRLPASLFPAVPARIGLTGPAGLALRSSYVSALPPEELELADLGLVLLLPPREAGADYDLYRWDLLPDVLVFDFRDYAVQDRYLKRLAFFVEKQGFKGRLAADEEIEGLHGWNAHDYRPEDLAAFFQAARERSFPLSREERELAGLLAARGLVVERGGKFEAGKGALISIARESVDYLRRMFLTHESTHALFFADEEYRRFATESWASLSREEKWFWKLYFGWMNYDTANDYLMANEFQAYLVQQPVQKAEEYFTKVLPPRLLEKHPELAPRIEAYMAEFGPSFAVRAASVESFLSAKYGILAGRAYFLQ